MPEREASKDIPSLHSLIQQILLLNPATNFPEDNRIAAAAASTGVLSIFPMELYSVAQDILWPLMVRRTRLNDRQETRKLFSPIELVPATTASWRLQVIANNPLTEGELKKIEQETVIYCAAKDRVLDSKQEGTRLQSLMPNARRVILADSGHTALLEDEINLADMLSRSFESNPELLTSSDEGNYSTKNRDTKVVDKKDEKLSDLSRRVAFETTDDDWVW